MQFLLPHSYKGVGTVIAPLGLIFWIAMQLGYLTKGLIFVFGEPMITPPYHIVNVAIAIVSFFSFLIGIYFIAFAKEKIEDEMVQRTRLDSFQFAALVQILVIITGFLVVLVAGDPGESGIMLFFIILVLLFWLSFISRFNYILHVKLRQ